MAENPATARPLLACLVDDRVAPTAWIGEPSTIPMVFIGITADAPSRNVSALHIQAVTGLLAIVVLLVVMNWFFHRIYWTGWIGAHNRRKRDLLDSAGSNQHSHRQLLLGLGMLGFTSVYREGFEVVLFLQSYRLQLGGAVVLGGVLIGTVLAAVVAVLTFVLRRKLPYKKMLVVTGLMLAVVLFVMVGEQAQEMQLAHWLPTTPIHALAGRIPDWAGLWFSVFHQRRRVRNDLRAAPGAPRRDAGVRPRDRGGGTAAGGLG
jgi:high-affinity iron transporter